LGSFLDSLGRVVLDGLTAGNYDLLFSAPSDTSTLSSGGVAIAPTRISGVNVSAGQAVDVGVVALFMGSFIQGQVLDATTGLPIAGEPIMARPSDNALKVSAVTTTDASGHYVLRGLDPTRRWYDVTAGPRGAIVTGAALPLYASRRQLSVDVSSGATVDFSLSPALATVSGRVVPVSGATLTSTLGPGDPIGLGAVVTLQSGGLIPSEDPLADLSLRTNPDGTFVIPAVATGSYRLTATAIGQGSSALSVVVTTTAVDLGTISLSAGGSLSGAIRLPDGTAPLVSEVRSIAAVTPDSSW
jgi:hypothetical protein